MTWTEDTFQAHPGPAVQTQAFAPATLHHAPSCPTGLLEHHHMPPGPLQHPMYYPTANNGQHFPQAEGQAAAARPSTPKCSRMLVISPWCPPKMRRLEAWGVNDYALIKEIGSGAASVVYQAICRKSNVPVALKIYKKRKLGILNLRQVEREIQIHARIQHENVIDLYGAFEDDHKIYLVMQYATGGDLFDELRKLGGKMKETEAVKLVLVPFLRAISHLHDMGIVHRDIKPENTLFDGNNTLKIADFGLSIDSTEERPVTRLGTLDYMAPEVLICPDKLHPDDNKNNTLMQYGLEVDTWAVGVLAYEIMIGRPPFGMAVRDNTMEAIMTKDPRFPSWMSEGAKDFIRKALAKTSASRPSVRAMLSHPWIASHVAPLRPQAQQTCWSPATSGQGMISAQKVAAQRVVQSTVARSKAVAVDSSRKTAALERPGSMPAPKPIERLRVNQMEQEKHRSAPADAKKIGVAAAYAMGRRPQTYGRPPAGADSTCDSTEDSLQSSFSSFSMADSYSTSSSSSHRTSSFFDEEGLAFNRSKGSEAENLSLARQIKKQLANGPYKNIISSFRLVGKSKGQKFAVAKDSLKEKPVVTDPKLCQMIQNQRSLETASKKAEQHLAETRSLKLKTSQMSMMNGPSSAATEKLLSGASDAIIHIQGDFSACPGSPVTPKVSSTRPAGFSTPQTKPYGHPQTTFFSPPTKLQTYKSLRPPAGYSRHA